MKKSYTTGYGWIDIILIIILAPFKLIKRILILLKTIAHDVLEAVYKRFVKFLGILIFVGIILIFLVTLSKR
jgi:hypothetical protein